MIGDIILPFFFQNPPEISRNVTLLYYVLEIPHKSRFYPGISVKLC